MNAYNRILSRLASRCGAAAGGAPAPREVCGRVPEGADAGTQDYLRYIFPDRRKLVGATSIAEQAYCEWYAAERFTGTGCVVEFGPWLGSLTAPTALGLTRNPCGKNKTIDSYDLFKWETGSNGWAAGTPFVKLYQPGECFLPLYEQLVAPFQGEVVIRPHQADLSTVSWNGAPIEFLINDAWKAIPIMTHTAREFFPSLLAGATVFHQDYLWSSESFIHVGMYWMRDHFTFQTRVQNSSTSVFQMQSTPSKEVLARFAALKGYSDLREDEVDAAFAWSASHFDEPDARLVVNAGKAWLLHKMGHDDRARRLFAENRASEHYKHPFYQFQEKVLRDWGFGFLMQ